ncbi:MAG: hypothetical protein AB7P31_01940 [Steroidobacteraceae bacterium]
MNFNYSRIFRTIVIQVLLIALSSAPLGLVFAHGDSAQGMNQQTISPCAGHCDTGCLRFSHGPVAFATCLADRSLEPAVRPHGSRSTAAKTRES